MDSTKISLKEKLGYGAGDLASNFIWASTAAFLTFFYTDVVGLSAVAVGSLLLFARVFDGFVDIGVGILVDKTKSKHGKARPWLKWLAIPFGISGILLFSAPDLGPTGSLIYAYATYLLVNIIYSGINVPYGVLNSMITQDPYQRSLLNIFRMFMAIAGTLLITSFTLPLIDAFGGGKGGWLATFTIFGIISSVLMLVTYRTTKERVKPSVIQKEVPTIRGIKALLRNKYWALMVIYKVLINTGMAVGAAINVYYAQYILHDKSLVGILGLLTYIPVLIGMLFIAPIIKKFGKRNAAIFGVIIYLLGSSLMIVDPTNVTVVLIATLIKSIGSIPITASMFAMLADTIDYGEWKTGIRSEGLVYSAGSFGGKAGSGLGAALVGWLLAWGGYVGGQETISVSASASIQFMFIYLPIILYAIIFVILKLYTLDKQYPQIIKELREAASMGNTSSPGVVKEADNV
ncbi:MFS transporter [Paenibacillus chitinolyticus]